MKGKGGAVEWSVGKLMSIVLLMVVLALVVYGVSSGGLVPLFERVGGMFDEVLLFFGVGDDGGGVEGCAVPYLKSIEGVGSGMLTRCVDRCVLVFDEEVAGYKEFGIFGGMGVGNFRADSFVLRDDIVDVGKVNEERVVYRELRGVFYSVLRGEAVGSDAVDIKEDASVEVKSLMEPWDTVLYLSVPESKEKLLLKYEVGDDRIGVWHFFENGKWVEFSENPWERLLAASDQGWWNDNKVYWRVGEVPDNDLDVKGTAVFSVPILDDGVVDDEWYRILPGMNGDNGEMDGIEDRIPFVEWLNEKRELLNSNSDKKIQRLISFDKNFAGRMVSFNGKEYNVLISSERDRPLIYISSEPKYGIYVYDNVFVLEESGGGIVWGMSNNMRMLVLSDEEWEDKIVVNKIYRFMEGNC